MKPRAVIRWSRALKCWTWLSLLPDGEVRAIGPVATVSPANAVAVTVRRCARAEGLGA